MSLDANLHWLLSFYRTSEIGGALFFGQVARSLPPSATQCDMSRHFAEEAQHARYWTECLEALGAQPLRLGRAYQDQYAAATGMPSNLMEVLAITQVFERRVVSQYALHLRVPGIPGAVADTLDRIMRDEKWHLEWVRGALGALEPKYGADAIDATLARYTEADRAVYQSTAREHGARIDQLMLARR